MRWSAGCGADVGTQAAAEVQRRLQYCCWHRRRSHCRHQHVERRQHNVHGQDDAAGADVGDQCTVRQQSNAHRRLLDPHRRRHVEGCVPVCDTRKSK